MSQTDDFLMHHGVKGMKWGVRKSIQRVGRTIKARKAAKYKSQIDSVLKRNEEAEGMYKAMKKAGFKPNAKEMKSIREGTKVLKRLSKLSTKEIKQLIKSQENEDLNTFINASDASERAAKKARRARGRATVRRVVAFGIPAAALTALSIRR